MTDRAACGRCKMLREEVERLADSRDEAVAEVERLREERDDMGNRLDAVHVAWHEAEAEVERLRVGA